jgi:hypothetical protein
MDRLPWDNTMDQVFGQYGLKGSGVKALAEVGAKDKRFSPPSMAR